MNYSRSRIQILSDNSFVNDIASQVGIMGGSADAIDFGYPGLNFTSFSGFGDPVPSLTRNQTFRFRIPSRFVHENRHEIRWRNPANPVEHRHESRPYRGRSSSAPVCSPVNSPTARRLQDREITSPIFCWQSHIPPPAASESQTIIFAAGISSPSRKTIGASVRISLCCMDSATRP